MSKKWTAAEEKLLRESYGEISIKTIAKNLNRSENAVIVRKNRMKLGTFLEQGDYITFSQLLKTIYNQSLASNSYRYTDSKVWSTAPVRKKRVHNKSFKIIYLDDFWKWAEEHKSKLDFSKFEENALGEEPEWVKIKRKADILSKRKVSKWTKAEDQYLERLLSENRYSYQELEDKLNRTSDAIRRRIYDLALDDTRPVRNKARKWTDAEKKKLITMKDAGYSLTEIAKQLERSGQSVRGMWERVQHPDYAEKRRIKRNERKRIWN